MIADDIPLLYNQLCKAYYALHNAVLKESVAHPVDFRNKTDMHRDHILRLLDQVGVLLNLIRMHRMSIEATYGALRNDELQRLMIIHGPRKN